MCQLARRAQRLHDTRCGVLRGVACRGAGVQGRRGAGVQGCRGAGEEPACTSVSHAASSERGAPSSGLAAGTEKRLPGGHARRESATSTWRRK